MANGSSSPTTRPRPIAPTGRTMKFAASATATRRALRSGAKISPTERPSPIPSMLETTKASIAIGTTA